MASAAGMMVASATVSEIVKKFSEYSLDEVGLLWGVKDEFKKLKDKLEMIRDVLEDAETREVQDASVRHWLNGLRDILYDIEDLMDDCYSSSPSYNQHGSTSSGSSLPPWYSSVSKKLKVAISEFQDLDMGQRIKAINDRMEQIHKDREQLKLVQTVQIQGSVTSQAPAYKRSETTSRFIESEVVGIDEDAERLVRLMEEPNMAAGGRVFAIVGMGGIGKTTLAQKVYNKSNLGIRIWVCVSQDYKENDVLKQIIRSAGGYYQEDQTKEELYSKMEKLLDGKHILLVLDDLWSDGVWRDCLRVPFQTLTAKSRVLITTRDEGIARQMKAVHKHQVKELSDDDAWSLLCKVVCQGNMDEIEGLEDVGMQIVRKCKGLPLAIKVIGGVLNRRRINEWEWRTVLSKVPEDGTSEIMSVLRLSYMDLPSYLKPCFLFCSLFPEDYEIRRLDVIHMWVAEGLLKEQEGGARQMEDLGELYYDELVMRSLLQLVSQQHPNYRVKMCKMHDLVRDLAISMTHGEHIIGHDRQQGGSRKARRLSISRVEELKQIPERVKNQKYCSLRSLLVFQIQNMEVIPPSLSDKLKCLRVLDLCNSSFKHLPDSIGELVHLRYLNLTHSSIVELPNSICNLRHLQTLLLWGSRISKIPKGFSQLQKLRHLEVPDHVDIHAGIGKLTDLQTLQDFTVRNRDDRCNIEELNCLTQLRYLAVHDLGMVPGPTEAREAAIENKTHLRFLELMDTNTDEIKGEQEIRRMKEILEEFRPNESLEYLIISNFDARELPGWISMTTPLLRNLNYLELDGINNLQLLPSLGHLPQLRILRVNQCACKCDPMKTLGLDPHFDRGGNGGGAYPRLEELYLWSMDELEEWGGGGERNDIFPRLKLLELMGCPKLRSLPIGLLDSNMKLRAGIKLSCDDVAFDENIYLQDPLSY